LFLIADTVGTFTGRPARPLAVQPKRKPWPGQELVPIDMGDSSVLLRGFST
jgi:hypothetical protein